ncbi:MAG: hypothetical protein N2748_00615, partial [candidate division WOR-3 bacterium]|nr:hypothetical protein [candidate division WOR-3 bacterium]
MKYYKLIANIVIISLFAVITVWAEAQKSAVPVAKETTKTAEPTKTVATSEVIGKVIAVDAVKNCFTIDVKKVNKKGKTVKVSMTFAAGKDIKIADIVKNEKVMVKYKKEGEK